MVIKLHSQHKISKLASYVLQACVSVIMALILQYLKLRYCNA